VDKILINAVDPEECRVAMLDHKGVLQEYYTDTAQRQLSLNNIYKGQINNIEPSLQAVFVNFGSDRNGFLQATDIHPEYYQEKGHNSQGLDIKRALLKNQPILVQVTKEPSLIKGAALTTYISLAGRFVVLTPGRTSVGVSRKIMADRERARLKAIAETLPVPEGCGYIVRTVAENRTKEELAEDLYQVYNLWEDIRKQALTANSPGLVYREHDLAIKILRDHYTPDCSEILVDETETYKKVLDYIKVIAPGQQSKVRLHLEKRPIFARHQLEQQLETIHQAQVRLRGGGSIVITPTEALVSIDVNSGKGTREENLEDTAFNTNMEAAEEVARQLRLRDLGGVVVIDFIDMRDERHRREVERKLREASKDDKAKMDFASISKFGLLELTRQKLRPPIEAGIYTTCPHCKGKGQVFTSESAAIAFLRQATQLLSIKGGLGSLTAKLNQDVANYLLNHKRADLLRLEERHKAKILLSGDVTYPPSYSEISTEKKSQEVQNPKPGQIVRSPEEPEENHVFHPAPAPVPVPAPQKAGGANGKGKFEKAHKRPKRPFRGAGKAVRIFNE
jgi:ribonuclease E